MNYSQYSQGQSPAPTGFATPTAGGAPLWSGQPLAVYEVPRPITIQVVHVQYTGGIIGIFFNRARKFSATCQFFLSQGYRLSHVLPPRPSLSQRLAELFLLVLTLYIVTVEQGEMLVFERPTDAG